MLIPSTSLLTLVRKSNRLQVSLNEKPALFNKTSDALVKAFERAELAVILFPDPELLVQMELRIFIV